MSFCYSQKNLSVNYIEKEIDLLISLSCVMLVQSDESITCISLLPISSKFLHLVYNNWVSFVVYVFFFFICRNPSTSSNTNFTKIFCSKINSRNGEEDCVPMYRCKVWYAKEISRMVPKTGMQNSLYIIFSDLIFTLSGFTMIHLRWSKTVMQDISVWLI